MMYLMNPTWTAWPLTGPGLVNVLQGLNAHLWVPLQAIITVPAEN